MACAAWSSDMMKTMFGRSAAAAGPARTVSRSVKRSQAHGPDSAIGTATMSDTMYASGSHGPMMPPAPTLSPEAKYRLLLKLSQEIGRSLDLQEVMEYLLESVRTAVEFDAAGVFVLNRRVPLGQEPGGRLIAGMATVGFDDTPRDEDPMLRRGEGIIGHVIATGQTVIAPDVRLNPVLRPG